MRIIHRDDITTIIELSVEGKPWEGVEMLCAEINDSRVTLYKMFSSRKSTSLTIRREDAVELAKYLLQGENGDRGED